MPQEKNDRMARLDKWLLCSTERVGGGLIAGFLGSAVLRHRWPIILGLGVAMGLSVGDYQATCKDDEDQNGNGNGPKGKSKEENNDEKEQQEKEG